MNKTINLKALSAKDIGKFYVALSVPYIVLIGSILLVVAKLVPQPGNPDAGLLFNFLESLKLSNLPYIVGGLGLGLCVNFLIGAIIGFILNIALKITGGLRISGTQLNA
jgi:hypothetical protein